MVPTFDARYAAGGSLRTRRGRQPAGWGPWRDALRYCSGSTDSYREAADTVIRGGDVAAIVGARQVPALGYTVADAVGNTLLTIGG